ncbi:hypothetical protein V2P54_01920 [Mycoplasmoides gallisepticum]
MNNQEHKNQNEEVQKKLKKTQLKKKLVNQVILVIPLVNLHQH